MPNRVIKDSVWSSKSLAKLKPYYQDQWLRWLLMADDWGCFNADPEIIKGLVYPKRKETKAKVQVICQVYCDAGMLFLWEQGGREWGFFTAWDNHQFCNKLGVGEDGKYTKHRRKTPEPPDDLLTLYIQEHTEEFDNVRHNSTKVVNPIPNPIPKPNPITPTAGEANKYFYDTLGNYATDMASVIQDFEATRKGGKIQPKVIIKIVDSWKPFGGNLLLEAKKEWDKGRYAKEGMKENYFLGICRRLKGQTEFRRRKGLP